MHNEKADNVLPPSLDHPPLPTHFSRLWGFFCGCRNRIRRGNRARIRGYWSQYGADNVWTYEPLVTGGKVIDDVSLALSLAYSGDERVEKELGGLFNEEDLW